MTNRFPLSRFTTLFALVTILPLTGQTTGQTNVAPASKRQSSIQNAAHSPATPQTPDGQPDLQGVWMNTWATPFERPKELAGRQNLTDAEVGEFRKRVKRLFKDQPSDFPVGDNLFLAALANPDHWKNATGSVESADEMLDRDFDNRTSIVIDPPTGESLR
jgi:hypothetical protein